MVCASAGPDGDGVEQRGHGETGGARFPDSGRLVELRDAVFARVGGERDDLSAGVVGHQGESALSAQHTTCDVAGLHFTRRVGLSQESILVSSVGIQVALYHVFQESGVELRSRAQVAPDGDVALSAKYMRVETAHGVDALVDVHLEAAQEDRDQPCGAVSRWHSLR